MRAQRRRLLVLAAGTGLSALPLRPFAQAAPWPDRPVRILVPSPPGGPADLYARAFAAHAARQHGSPFFVENRPGAAGTLASQALARSAPDGYTLLIGSNSTFVVTPMLQKNPGYDPDQDFAPIGTFVSYPTLLVGRTGLPFRDLPGLIAYARSNPGRLNFGSFGIGSTGHLAHEYFCQLAAIKSQHVNYPGNAAMLQALVKGETDYSFLNFGDARPMLAAGKLVPLAISSRKRSSRLPQVPTIAESGFPGFDVRIWLGFMTRGGTPRPIIDALGQTLATFVEASESRRIMEAADSDPQFEPPRQMGEQMALERKQWQEVLRAARIMIE